MKQEQDNEVDHQRALNALEISHARELAAIEAEKFSSLLNAIGPKTLQRVAQAGPETQQRLLKALGIRNITITDGRDLRQRIAMQVDINSGDEDMRVRRGRERQMSAMAWGKRDDGAMANGRRGRQAL